MTAQIAHLEHNYEGLVSDFQALNCVKPDEALINAFNAVPNCLPATKDAYRFITPLAAVPDKDKPTIPAMLGMTYKGIDDLDNFKKRFLKKYGKEVHDWIIMKNSEFFNSVSLD